MKCDVIAAGIVNAAKGVSAHSPMLHIAAFLFL